MEAFNEPAAHIDDEIHVSAEIVPTKRGRGRPPKVKSALCFQ